MVDIPTLEEPRFVDIPMSDDDRGKGYREMQISAEVAILHPGQPFFPYNVLEAIAAVHKLNPNYQVSSVRERSLAYFHGIAPELSTTYPELTRTGVVIETHTTGLPQPPYGRILLTKTDACGVHPDFEGGRGNIVMFGQMTNPMAIGSLEELGYFTASTVTTNGLPVTLSKDEPAGKAMAIQLKKDPRRQGLIDLMYLRPVDDMPLFWNDEIYKTGFNYMFHISREKPKE